MMSVEVNGRIMILDEDRYKLLLDLLEHIPPKHNINDIIDFEIQAIETKIRLYDSNCSYDPNLFKNYYELAGALRELTTLKKIIGEKE